MRISDWSSDVCSSDLIMRPTRFGDYDDFLKWLSRQTDDASKEISRRAHGKAQLSGHIRQNFFGLRQFFLVNPGNMSLLSKQEADTYTLSKDAKTAAALSAFVRSEEHTSELQSLMRISYAVFCL